ncbi:TetR/AcrR family transcriptional regulator [Phenylobacterium sp.]|uniref:TetR/AcrR family transcriptional regulator n=1 Tax=Phenylobacterium sp. TaxID=1871053 RepID=UPI003982ED82
MARQADHIERRRLFAAAALNVISRDGLEGLTVREVAREAGFTTGALTHYFKSKDDVLIAASEHAAEQVRAPMEEAALESSARAALRHLLYTALPTTTVMKRRWRFWMAFWERAAHSPQVNRVMKERYREWSGRIAGQICRAQEQGEAPAALDADLTARELVALVDGIGVQVLIAGKLAAPAQRRFIDSLIEARLGPPPVKVVEPPAARASRQSTRATA